MALTLGLAALVWLAWPAARGPTAVAAKPGWVVVDGHPRVEVTAALQLRAAAPHDRPEAWDALPPGFEAHGPDTGPEAVWAHLALSNPSVAAFDGVISVRAPQARTFGSFEGGFGGFRPGPTWHRQHRIPTIEVHLAPGESRELLLGVAPADAVVELWSARTFTDAMARADWALGLLLGLIFAVALYHVGNTFLRPDRTDVPFLALLLAWSGVGYVFLGYAGAHWGDLGPITRAPPWLVLTLAAAVWFARGFFEVGARSSLVAGAFRGLEWGLLALALFGATGTALPGALLGLLVALVSGAVLAVAAQRALQGRQEALVFAFAWLPFVAAWALAAGVRVGSAGEPAFLIAAAMSAFAFAFAVAERMARRRHKRARALRESQERYVYAARGAHDGLFDCHLRGGETFLSPRFFETLRLPEGALEPSPEALLDLVHADDRRNVRATLEVHFEDRERDKVQLECRALFGDRSVRWVMLRALLVREDEQVVRLVGSITDIHDRKVSEQALERRANYDSITGLQNRSRVLEHLDDLVELAQEGKIAFGVLSIDVDRFKNVNDSLGHAAGDEMLATLGRRLSLVAREADLVGRLTGDEFALVLADANLELPVLERVARRVLETISAPVTIDGHEIRPSASIGITHSDVGYACAANVLEDADVAMFEAKRAGKGQSVIFDETMRARVHESFELDRDMRAALERGEMEVYYQPIVRASDTKLAGFEALLRWNHPTRGVVSPAVFIPLAEETGMIRRLGRFALFEATAQLAAWQANLPQAKDWFVTVNVSPAQFGHDLLAEVLAALEAARIEPFRLKLEITEGLYLGDSGAVKAEMRRIAEAGVPFSLDDFGTGFSSLSYLHELPFDVLKVDRSFMRNLLADRQSEAIVKSVLGLASGLGMASVAEGVETEEVAERMRGLGTSFFQGYLFGRPLPPGALEKDLRARGLLPPLEREPEAGLEAPQGGKGPSSSRSQV